MAVFDDGRQLTYGTMGGDGQPQTQAAIFTRIARFGMATQAAVTAPRWLLGKTWGEGTPTLKVEARVAAETFVGLQSAGHEVERVGEFEDFMGHAGAILRRPDGVLMGATDPRSDGAVAGV
jgi:gamma-glutamyltranspeptidase/glutathione hydrolase